MGHVESVKNITPKSHRVGKHYIGVLIASDYNKQ